MTGHLLGAAGAIEAIACVKILQHDFIPATINTKNIEPDFADLFDFPIGIEGRSKTVKVIQICSFLTDTASVGITSREDFTT